MACSSGELHAICFLWAHVFYVLILLFGSKIQQLQKMAVTMIAYKTGMFAWYDCHLSMGKAECINNKIKVMKRNAFGFIDEKYFILRLYALHNCRITRNVG